MHRVETGTQLVLSKCVNLTASWQRAEEPGLPQTPSDTQQGINTTSQPGVTKRKGNTLVAEECSPRSGNVKWLQVQSKNWVTVAYSCDLATRRLKLGGSRFEASQGKSFVRPHLNRKK
jgi:hypothetical protein